ncbi:hypothetical protein EVAR_86338_1 [Eumeta japonica]|uniref:Uncharacterized protein n=1 Tax=Eumeta variegata TaxID=151549 RepID=A0A4C1X360_EUMVA|nr:hypothetical protein EVAR_86338_1 [Eumeta japonica]
MTGTPVGISTHLGAFRFTSGVMSYDAVTVDLEEQARPRASPGPQLAISFCVPTQNVKTLELLPVDNKFGIGTAFPLAPYKSKDAWPILFTTANPY